MTTYFLWKGVGAIEDLEDVHDRETAFARLQTMTEGDWTLWERKGPHTKLLAVAMWYGAVIRFF